MGKSRQPIQGESGESSFNVLARDETISKQYTSRPSPRALSRSGQIDPQAGERAVRMRASGPPARPFRELIAALRAERERQGLNLADVAERTGIDRAAIHKLEIGLNSNPTHAILARYASALGTRIGWHLETIPKKSTLYEAPRSTNSHCLTDKSARGT